MIGLGLLEILFLVVFLGLGVFLVIAPPVYHAWRRGYNPFVWGLASFLSYNPIFVLVVLASVPHRRRLRLRDQFTQELEAKLAALAGGPPGLAGDSRDAGRIDTSALGDRATVVPRDRSIGDDPTRL